MSLKSILYPILVAVALAPAAGQDRSMPGGTAYPDYEWKDIQTEGYAEKPALAEGEKINLFQGALHTGKRVIWIVHSKVDGKDVSALLAWDPKSGASRRIPVTGETIRGLAWDPAVGEVLVRFRNDIAWYDGDSLTEKRRTSFIKINYGWRDMCVQDDELFIIGEKEDSLDVFDRTSLKQKETLAAGQDRLQRIIPFGDGALLLWSSYRGATLHRFDRKERRITGALHATIPHRALFKASGMGRGRIGVFDIQETKLFGILVPCGSSMVNIMGGAQSGAGGRAYRFSPVRQVIRAVLVMEPADDIPESSLLFPIPHRSAYTQELSGEKYSGDIVFDPYGNRFVRTRVGPLRKGEKREIELYRSDITRYQACFDIIAADRPLEIDGSFDRYLGDNPIYRLSDPLVIKTHRKVMENQEPYTKKIIAAHAFAMTIKPLWDGKNEPVPFVLKNMHGGCNEHTRVIVAFLRLSGIPARYAWNHIWRDGAENEFGIDHAIAEAWISGTGWVPLEGLGKTAGYLRPYILFGVGFPESGKHKPKARTPRLELKKQGGKIQWMMGK